MSCCSPRDRAVSVSVSVSVCLCLCHTDTHTHRGLANHQKRAADETWMGGVGRERYTHLAGSPAQVLVPARFVALFYYY